jgi:hypothetical protein
MESELFALEFAVISELRQGLSEIKLGVIQAPWDESVWYVEPGGMVDVALNELGAVLSSVEWDEDQE